MTDHNKPYFGYFSAKCAENSGTITYRMADGTEGILVWLSQSPDAVEKTGTWDDLVLVGELALVEGRPSVVRESLKWGAHHSGRSTYKTVKFNPGGS